MSDHVLEPCEEKEFSILRQLGEGGSAHVFQVQHTLSHRIFALKRVPLTHLRSIKAEACLLSRLSLHPHPHLIRLRTSFLSVTHAHFILDFLDGGDLLSHLEEAKLFSEDHARSCMAEIVSAVAHLHAHGILHRDIKPENVLLDSDGHATLADLGLAIDLAHESPAHHMIRSAPCGTHLFMAPEMLRGEEYGYALDWWSVGVLLYEMVAGHVPFGHRGKDVDDDDIDKEILARRPRLPTDLSRDCHSLLKGLLQKNPNKRLHTAHNIKRHPWFKNIDWAKLEDQCTSCVRAAAACENTVGNSFGSQCHDPNYVALQPNRFCECAIERLPAEQDQVYNGAQKVEIADSIEHAISPLPTSTCKPPGKPAAVHNSVLQPRSPPARMFHEKSGVEDDLDGKSGARPQNDSSIYDGLAAPLVASNNSPKCTYNHVRHVGPPPGFAAEPQYKSVYDDPAPPLMASNSSPKYTYNHVRHVGPPPGFAAPAAYRNVPRNGFAAPALAQYYYALGPPPGFEGVHPLMRYALCTPYG
ncbi:hypothetical protein L7F22_037134 [Adiantum nelumboides]|nr:hypothetical protein [Adiantum nelumboides]